MEHLFPVKRCLRLYLAFCGRGGKNTVVNASNKSLKFQTRFFGLPFLRKTGTKHLVGEARKKQNRNPKTSYLIIDSQSVKNTDTAHVKGYDAGKKSRGSNGILRLILGGFLMLLQSQVPKKQTVAAHCTRWTATIALSLKSGVF